MEIGFSLTPTQKLALSPQLQQALKILQMPTLDLCQEIETALLENPFLETEDNTEKPADESPSEKEELIWDAPASEDGDLWDTVPYETTLSAFLQEQLGCLALDLAQEMRVQWLIGALDKNGFLAEPLESIIESYPVEDDHDTDTWLSALETLQAFEPTGVGAGNYQECLLIQLSALRKADRIDAKTLRLCDQLIRHHLEELAQKKYAALSKSLQCGMQDLSRAIDVICTLNPHPAANFDSVQLNYVIPEIEVFRRDDIWHVKSLSNSHPRIKINEMYASALHCSTSDREAAIWQGRLTEARQLVRAVNQRKETLLKVSSLIVRKQQEFFTYGPQKMQPLVLRTIAEELGMHESTISRVTNGKYLTSPQGVFELKYFFSSSVANADSDSDGLSATAVKAELKKLVGQEDPRKPLSDAKLAVLLQEKNISVARRTIAKYREAIGIPSASLRKKL